MLGPLRGCCGSNRFVCARHIACGRSGAPAASCPSEGCAGLGLEPFPRVQASGRPCPARTLICIHAFLRFARPRAFCRTRRGCPFFVQGLVGATDPCTPQNPSPLHYPPARGVLLRQWRPFSPVMGLCMPCVRGCEALRLWALASQPPPELTVWTTLSCSTCKRLNKVAGGGHLGRECMQVYGKEGACRVERDFYLGCQSDPFSSSVAVPGKQG